MYCKHCAFKQVSCHWSDIRFIHGAKQHEYKVELTYIVYFQEGVNVVQKNMPSIDAQEKKRTGEREPTRFGGKRVKSREREREFVYMCI